MAQCAFALAITAARFEVGKIDQAKIPAVLGTAANWLGARDPDGPTGLSGAAEIDAENVGELHGTPSDSSAGSIAPRMKRANHPPLFANSVGGPCSVTRPSSIT